LLWVSAVVCVDTMVSLRKAKVKVMPDHVTESDTLLRTLDVNPDFLQQVRMHLHRVKVRIASQSNVNVDVCVCVCRC
jgi:hypothetical protein